MTTVVNNPSSGDNSGTGLIVGIILAVILIFLFVRFGLPAIRGTGGGTNVNVTVPSVDSVTGGSAQ